MSKNVGQDGRRTSSPQGETLRDAGSDRGTAASDKNRERPPSPATSGSHDPLQRVTIRDKYDVVIRPSSPPFVSIVPTGQPVSHTPASPQAGSSYSAPGSQRALIQARASNLTEISDLSLGQIQEREIARAEATTGNRVDRIYSPVARELTKHNRAETTADVIARAQELLPLGEAARPTSGLGSLSIKSTVQAAALIGRTKALQLTSRSSTLMDVSQERLDRLWDGGKGHIGYANLVSDLQKCNGIALHWADGDGRVRTLRPVIRRPFSRTIKDTDPGSSSPELRRGLIRFASGERGYVKVDAAAALAVTRLMANDVHNFARIIAACPSIVETLLDRKKIGHGPIFTDQTIWLIIAYAIPPLRAHGGKTSRELKCLTLAFENYLTFHNPDNLKGPYVELIKWAYQDSGQQADALANSVVHFTQCIERIWQRMCPKENPIRDILDRSPVADELDNSIAAISLDIIFSGVDAHLKQVVERRKAYNKAITRIISIGGALPIDALKGVAGGLDGGFAGSAIGAVCDLLLTEAGNIVSDINKRNSYSEMRTFFSTLYDSVKENAKGGRFVPGQKVLSSAQLGALLPEAELGPIHQDDIESPEGNRSSIRRGLQRSYVGVDSIDADEFVKIYAKRVALGSSLKKKINDSIAHNPLS